jgi:hypothetical protein
MSAVRVRLSPSRKPFSSFIIFYKNIHFRLNEEELMVDTLALRDDEGRSYQR